MPGGVIGGVGRTLADWLRGAARALDGLSARLDPAAPAAAPATAVLAERFPGAPEHWLAYIAERAPYLLPPDPARPPQAPSSPRQQRASQPHEHPLPTPIREAVPPSPEPARRSRAW